MDQYYPFVCFVISQLVFVPTYLATTRILFKPGMKLLGALGYLMISPLFVYTFSIVTYGLFSLMFPVQVFEKLTTFADIFALILSFVFAVIYAGTGMKVQRVFMFFVYTCYYMVGMVFNLTYETPTGAIIFSVLVPIGTSMLMYRFFTLPLARIVGTRGRFHNAMLSLPIIGEVLLVFRFVLSIFSNSDSYLSRYDGQLQVYLTLMGYTILVYIFVCTYLVTRDIQQIETIGEQNRNLIVANEKINRLTLDILMALSAAMEAKDEYTNGHSLRVAELTVKIAKRIGYSKEKQSDFYRMAILHDIGKISIPDAIINKPGSLTNEEYKVIMRHPMKGAEILKQIEEVPELYIGALYHHEHWDGNGYPQGIAGADIPVVARIIAVADMFDAMTSRRSYRPALEKEVARKEIEKCIGNKLDPVPARIMLDMIDNGEV